MPKLDKVLKLNSNTQGKLKRHQLFCHFAQVFRKNQLHNLQSIRKHHCQIVKAI